MINQQTDNCSDQAASMRAMWSTVVLQAIKEARHEAKIETKRHAGRAMRELGQWLNSRDGYEVLTLAGIDPSKRATDKILEFAHKQCKTP